MGCFVAKHLGDIRTANEMVKRVYDHLHEKLCECGTADCTTDVRFSDFSLLVEPVQDLVRCVGELKHVSDELRFLSEKAAKVSAQQLADESMSELNVYRNRLAAMSKLREALKACEEAYDEAHSDGY